MDASQVIAVVTLVGAGLLLLFARPRVPEAIRVRADLAPQDVYDQYYAQSGLPRELVVELLEFIAHELELPVAKLRPSDGFGTDLREITRQWDSGMAVVLDALESDARRRKFPLQGPIRTIDEYVRAYCAVDAVA
jgi:hypothetical protein